MADSGIKQVKYPKDNLPPLSIFPDGTIGHYARYRLVSEDKNRYSHWSPTYAVRVPAFDYLGTVSVSSTSTAVTAIWGDEYNRPKYDIYVRWANSITEASVQSNVATITCHSDHGFTSGDQVEIANSGETFLDNNTFTVTTIVGTPHKFTISLQGSVPDGNYNLDQNAEAKLPYAYHGTSPIHTYSFMRRPLFDMIHVDVQVESVEKQYSEDLLIYDSPAITLI